MGTLRNESEFCAAPATQLLNRCQALEHAHSCVAFQAAACHEAAGCRFFLVASKGAPNCLVTPGAC